MRPTNGSNAAAQFPSGISKTQLRPGDFQNLRAEAIGGKLRIFWTPERLSANASVKLLASADAPGHWPARDWRSRPMTLRGPHWEASLPVDDVDVPMIYFAVATEAGKTNVSPLRICQPRIAGLEEPTRVFWPFVEGFEEGAESWRLLSAPSSTASLKTAPTAKNGLAALLVTVPESKRSVTVATTRVRGWQLQKQHATGLQLWLRTRSGKGRARFTLLAQAFTPEQVVAVSPREVTLTTQWQKVDVLFSDFPKLPVGAVDLFTIEFMGGGAQEFLVDELQLLGPWKLDPE